MNGAVYKIYRNSLENMRNTTEDWERVFSAFRKIWTSEQNEDIQSCILRLEEYVYGSGKGTATKTRTHRTM